MAAPIARAGIQALAVARAGSVFAPYGVIPYMYVTEKLNDKALKEGADPKELSQRWWQMQNIGQLRYRKHTLDEQAEAKAAEEYVQKLREQHVVHSYGGLTNSAKDAGISADEHYEKWAATLPEANGDVSKAAADMEAWVKERRQAAAGQEVLERVMSRRAAQEAQAK